MNTNTAWLKSRIDSLDYFTNQLLRGTPESRMEHFAEVIKLLSQDVSTEALILAEYKEKVIGYLGLLEGAKTPTDEEYFTNCLRRQILGV